MFTLIPGHDAPPADTAPRRLHLPSPRRLARKATVYAIGIGVVLGGADYQTLRQAAPATCGKGEIPVTVPGIHIAGVRDLVNAWPLRVREPAIRDVVAAKAPTVAISTVVKTNGLPGPMGVVPARQGGIYCLRVGTGAVKVQAAGVVLTGPDTAAELDTASNGGRARASDVTIARAAHTAGFRGTALTTAVAVALAESGGNPRAVCHNTGHGCSRTPTGKSIDRGLWQINNAAHPDVTDRCAYDPTCAARAAYRISKGGKTWTPWVAYQLGRHKQQGRWQRALTASKEAAR